MKRILVVIILIAFIGAVAFASLRTNKDQKQKAPAKQEQKKRRKSATNITVSSLKPNENINKKCLPMHREAFFMNSMVSFSFPLSVSVIRYC